LNVFGFGEIFQKWVNFNFSLAKSQQLDQDGLMAIFTQYGDHLYAKGDHDGAIQQYIRTIGKLEASYVIRKVSASLSLRGSLVLFCVSVGIGVCGG
jgi:hypothetical protein